MEGRKRKGTPTKHSTQTQAKRPMLAPVQAAQGATNADKTASASAIEFQRADAANNTEADKQRGGKPNVPDTDAQRAGTASTSGPDDISQTTTTPVQVEEGQRVTRAHASRARQAKLSPQSFRAREAVARGIIVQQRKASQRNRIVKARAAATRPTRKANKKKTPVEGQQNRINLDQSIESSDESDTEDLKSQVKQLAQSVQLLAAKVDNIDKCTPATSGTEEADLGWQDTTGELVTVPNAIYFSNVNRPAQFSAGVPLAAMVPDALKRKIWQHKYVEFSLLLDPDQEETYSFAITKSGETPAIQLKPRQKRFLSENDWQTAFDTFMAVYTLAYPNDLQDLITYGQTIKRMMTKKQRWWHYDRQFRMAREFNKCSWLTIRIDLQLESQQPTPAVAVKNNFRKPQARLPLGYCFLYHNRWTYCDKKQCKYDHSCPKCRGNHPEYRCGQVSSSTSRDRTDHGQRNNPASRQQQKPSDYSSYPGSGPGSGTGATRLSQ